MPAAKRAAPSASEHEDRKRCRDVHSGLAKVEGLPRDVAKMLGDMLDIALPVFREERHELQERVVALGEKVLRGHAQALETKIAAVAGSIAQSEQAVAPQAKAVEGAELAVKEKTALELEFKQALAETARAFQAAKRGLEEAEGSRSAFDTELLELEKRKAKFEQIQIEMVAPLTEGGLEEEKKTSLINSLVGMLGDLGLEQSIMIAIPASFGKSPEARGSFDTMVVAQLRGEVASRIAAASAELERAGATKAARTGAVEEASAKLRAAKSKQVSKAQTFRDSQAAREATQEDLSAKSSSLRDLNKEERKHKKDLTNIEARLDIFRDGALATYASLSQRTKPVPEASPEAAPEEASAAEA